MRRLLIVGCGDVALRIIPRLAARFRLYALTRRRERFAALRALGVIPVCGDLDRPHTLTPLTDLAHDVLHLAPPPAEGVVDTRTAHLIAILAKGRSLPQQMVYISTSGVYGNCAGEVVFETRPLVPQTERARRRANAERQLRAWGRRSGVRICILRVPGIYAADRLPLERLAAGRPVLNAADDIYTNHVHADDLARMTIAALYRGQPGRAYNAVDDYPLPMSDYFDLVADAFGLPHPLRLARGAAASRIPAATPDFTSESRRLANRRVKRELRVALRYPTVHHGLAAAAARVGSAGPPIK